MQDSGLPYHQSLRKWADDRLQRGQVSWQSEGLGYLSHPSEGVSPGLCRAFACCRISPLPVPIAGSAAICTIASLRIL